MSSGFQLTTGAILRFITAFNANNDDSLVGWEPVVQILSVKPVASRPGEVSRNRLIASDGTHFAQAMLATQHNHLVDEGQITKNTIVRFKKYHASNLAAGKRNLIIVLDLDILTQADEKLGDPKNIEHVNIPAEQPPVPGPSMSAPSATLVNGPPKKAATTTSRPPGAYPIYPIEQLSPYQNKWTIKVRVTQKSDIRNFSTQRGEGKLFGLTLTDESGEIRATAFNTVVDDLFDKFQEGKVYFISKAKVNIAKKKFGNSTNDFEISLDKNTEVEECLDASNVPEVRYNFVDLGKLEQMEKDAMIDVVGVVSEVGELQQFNSKAGKPLTKRDLTLVDRSQYSVRLTLWGKQAETFVTSDFPVMAFKGVKVGDFGGRTLSMVSSSTYQEHPNIPEANLLRGWYDGEGRSASFQNQSGSGGGGGGGGSGQFRRNELMTLNAVKDSNIGQTDNADFFSCRGTIIFIKSDNIMYTACPGDNCTKKVTETPSGDWRCEKCDRSYPEPNPRYLMSVHVADHTNQLWLQAFNDVGQTIIGMPAKELYEIQKEDHQRAQSIIEQGHCKTFNFSCRAKQDSWNDQTRIRYGINRVWALDYAVEGLAILEMLKAY